MKKWIKLIILVIVCIGCIGFIRWLTERIDDKTNMQPISIIAYKNNDETADAIQIWIDYNENQLYAEKSPIYSISVDNRLYEDIFPQYYSEEVIVLSKKPELNTQKNVAINDEKKTLYYKDYILKVDESGNTFTIMSRDGKVDENISLKYKDQRIIPCAFFVDNEENIAILGMTNEPLDESKLTTLLYSRNNEKVTLEEAQQYTDIWDKYDLSKSNCPNYTKNFVNITVDSLDGRFLYNETGKLLTFSPYEKKEQCFLTENDISQDIPSLNTYRDFYSFFSGFSSQNDYYVAKFPAYNEEEGTYAAFYNKTGDYLGHVRCNNDSISLYNEENLLVNELQGSFLPNFYVPSF
ncbi:MAG: hypothetical protein ACLRI6_15945 [Oscillospiraceae bacterium]|jgi:hypothetical protein